MREHTVRVAAVRPLSKTDGREQRWWIDTPDELVAAVHQIIEMLPSETLRAQARVGLALTLRHTDDVASPTSEEG